MARSICLATVLLSGVLMALFGVLKLGQLVRMVPHPVMLGFVNGLAIVIALAQLQHFKAVLARSQGTPLTLMLGLVLLTMAIAYLLPRLTRSVPPALVAILVVGALTNLLHLPTRTLGDMAHIAGGWPTLAWPDVPWNLDTLRTIAPYAVVMAVVGLLRRCSRSTSPTRSRKAGATPTASAWRWAWPTWCRGWRAVWAVAP